MLSVLPLCLSPRPPHPAPATAAHQNLPSPVFRVTPQGSQYKKTSLAEDLTVLGLAPPDSVMSL